MPDADHDAVRRLLLPVLTRPVLPRLPFMPPGKRYEVLERCWQVAEEDGPAKYGYLVLALPFVAAFLAGLAWREVTGVQGVDVPMAWVVVCTLAVTVVPAVWGCHLLFACHMKPCMLAELRRRGFCPVCGYDVSQAADRCPECGTMRR
jgi:hypothetical protein